MANSSEALLSLNPGTIRAEDVAKIHPDLFVRDDEGKPYTVRYEAANAMLLNEFLKEHRKVEEQTAINERQEATMNLNPTSGDWNTAANWTPATVPNGPNDVATFATSNSTTVSLSAETEVDSIVFASGASAFTIEPPSPFLELNVKGAGVINDSGISQNFVVGPTAFLNFYGTASAGSGIIYTESGSVGGSAIAFSDSSSAGNSTFMVPTGYMVFDVAATAADATFVIGGATSAHTSSGLIEFFNRSTAGNATFTVNGGSADAANGGGLTFFYAKASNSTMTVNGGTPLSAGGGLLQFLDVTDAENATLVAKGGTNGGLPGTILFSGNSRGGKARVEVFGTGEFDMSYRPPGLGLVVGSIEGDGVVFLGGNELLVGSTNRSTTFSGTIRDGGFQGGMGGSLRKNGSGKLRLTGTNTYTGGTTVERGTLFVHRTTDSGTGSGAVQVNRGAIGGTGIIAGAVTLGTATGGSALLIPGTRRSLVLTIQKPLTFNVGAVYDFALNSIRVDADQVIANRVHNCNRSSVSAVDNAGAVLSAGTTFSPISNTSATPIVGTFANLPDGSTFTVGTNTFQANYEGGDGNDLTLTVVP